MVTVSYMWFLTSNVCSVLERSLDACSQSNSRGSMYVVQSSCCWKAFNCCWLVLWCRLLGLALNIQTFYFLVPSSSQVGTVSEISDKPQPFIPPVIVVSNRVSVKQQKNPKDPKTRSFQKKPNKLPADEEK